MNPHYADVALRAGHRCEYCHAPEAVFNFAFEVEHIVPFARGGTDVESNRALACRCCNIRKAAHVTGVDPEGRVIEEGPRGQVLDQAQTERTRRFLSRVMI